MNIDKLTFNTTNALPGGQPGGPNPGALTYNGGAADKLESSAESALAEGNVLDSATAGSSLPDSSLKSLSDSPNPLAARLRKSAAEPSALNTAGRSNAHAAASHGVADFGQAAYSSLFPVAGIVRPGVIPQGAEDLEAQACALLEERGLKRGEDFQPYFENVNGQPWPALLLKSAYLPAELVTKIYADRNSPSSELYEARQKLLADAKAWKNQNPARIERVIPEFAYDTPSPQVIRSLLEKSDGLVIGEKHSARSSKRFVMDNLDTLKACGVRTLFLEHLYFDRDQPLIDEYLRAPADTPMPAELESRLRAICPEAKPGADFIALMNAAKHAGLRVLAIDCEASYRIDKGGLQSTEISKQQRILVMNFLADQFIKNCPDKGKWIAFVGGMHCNDFMGVPGLAERTGAPSVVVLDVREHAWPQGATSRQFVHSRPSQPISGIRPDVLIYCKQPSSGR